MNLIAKLKFLQKNLPVIIITGEERKTISSIISNILKSRLKVGEDFLIFEAKFVDIKNLELFLRTSKKPILVISGIENDFEQNIESNSKFIKNLPEKINLILNFDNVVKKMGRFPNLNTFTFGFEEGADFRVSDMRLNGGTNFKVNYQGKVIPFWLKENTKKEKIYSIVCSVLLATVFGLNLVEISQYFRER